MPPQSPIPTRAQSLIIRALAPLGARRVQAHLQAGLPEEFRPALEFLFSGKLDAGDAAVVARVEALRTAFARTDKTLYVYGVTQAPQPRTAQRLASTSSVTPQWGTFLYLLSRGMRAETILELGSCIGISGSYLASAPTCQQFVSLERSQDAAVVALAHISRVFPAAEVLNTPIDAGLAGALARFNRGIQLYYIDAFHRYEPTLRYFELAVPYLQRGALVIFDDIHWSQEMWQAWGALQARQGFSHTIDVGRFGLCVWQGGAVTPKQYNLAKYAGWARNYPARDVNGIASQ